MLYLHQKKFYTLNACSGFCYDFNVAYFNQCSTQNTRAHLYEHPFHVKFEKKKKKVQPDISENEEKNLVMNAVTFFTSIQDQGGISAESDSLGCRHDEWLILGDCDPCQRTTEINTRIRSATGLHNSELHVSLSSHKPSKSYLFSPMETFLKSTPSQPILVPLS